MWRILVSLISVVGGAVAARIYSRPATPASRASRAADDRPVSAAEPPRALVPGIPGYHRVPGLDEPLRPGWSRPRPEKIPRPTYWPAIVGLGITLTFWGMISTIFLGATGVIFLIIGITGWVWELMYESES